MLPKKIEEENGIPTNLASFKLDLQENEKKAKENLILPYTLYVKISCGLSKNTNSNHMHIYLFRVQNSSNDGGMIHYVPDEADDWDEEDPDDDLEI